MKTDFLRLKLLAGFQVLSLSLLEMGMVLTDILLEFCSSKISCCWQYVLIQGYRRVCSSQYCLISKFWIHFQYISCELTVYTLCVIHSMH